MIRLLFSNLSRRIFSYLVAAVLCFGVGVPAWAQFETRATNPFPEGAYSIATGDFNNDGKLDVVMITNNGFSVALGNGDGTLQKAVTYTTQLAYSLAVADFNGDGKLDIVVANENEDPSTVSVYLGNGDGTFQAPIDSNTTDYNEFVAVGDFQPAVNYDTTGLASGEIVVRDLNLDGKLDVANPSDPMSGNAVGIDLFWGNGDGTLQPAEFFSSGAESGLPAVGDLNGDGRPDFAPS
jgi:hypothetical protein